MSHQTPKFYAPLVEGTSSTNIAPVGQGLSVRRPPSERAMRLQSARPRPTPGIALAVAVADCWNGSNIRLRSAGLIPGPKSRTLNWMKLDDRQTEITMRLSLDV